MPVTPDLVASLVQTQFDALPAKRKPAVRGNGIHEWVPLSGIVAEAHDGQLYCLSLATGMKCLPHAKLPQAQGSVLHDWHAEILAIRAFNRFVLEECRRLLLAGAEEEVSPFLRRRTAEEMAISGGGSDASRWHAQPFAWRRDVALHMYCSEAPCGDASMELTMAAQTDAAPWEVPVVPLPTPADTTIHSLPLSSSPTDSSSLPTPTPGETEAPPTLPGRAYFSLLGAVRRKPARGDAPATLSKSCSDKLALRQCTSLLASLTTLLASPEDAYIRTLVLPRSQLSAAGCRRAFSAEGEGEGVEVAEGGEGGEGVGRMRPLADRAWGGGYAFRPFDVCATDVEFAFSRRAVAQRAVTAAVAAGGNGKIAPSNLAVAWTARLTVEGEAQGEGQGQGAVALEETTLGGTIQGRKPQDPRGASFASRRRLWELATEVAGLLTRSHASTIATAAVQDIQRALSAPGSVLYPDANAAGGEEHKKNNKKNKTYGEVKASPLLLSRQRTKKEARAGALRGWVRNIGDEAFIL